MPTFRSLVGAPGIPTKTSSKEIVIESMRHNTELFCRKVLPGFFTDKFQDFHREFTADIETGFPRIAGIFPRDHGKTTLIQGITLKKIAYRLFRYGIFIGESEDQAAENLKTIMDVVEFDERFQYYFGKMKSPRKWNETKCEFIDPTNPKAETIKIICRGSRQRIRGFKKGSRRVDWCWGDDFESELNTATKELRAQVARWMYGSVAPTIKKATPRDPIPGQLILTGTVSHFESYLMKVTRSKNWKSRIYPIETNGVFLWPDKYGRDFVDMKEDEAIEFGTLDDFYREYYCQPINPKSAFILPSEIHHYEMEVVKSNGRFYLKMGDRLIPLAVYIGTDFALGRKNSDDAGAVVIGVTPKGHIYVLDIVFGGYSVGQVMEIVFDLVDKWKPRKVGFEDVATQGIGLEWMQAEKRRRGSSFHLVAVKVGTTESKSSRLIQTVQPYYRAGKIHTKFGDHDDLDREALDFRPNKRDNRDGRLDALFIALKISRPSDGEELENGEEQKEERVRYRSLHPLAL